MKIAVLNDIHGNFYLLEKILDELKNENIVKYIFCGDLITCGADDNKVLDCIKNLDSFVIAGNREVSLTKEVDDWISLNQFLPMKYVYDRLTFDNKQYINYLPTFKMVEIGGKKICISHGSPYNVRELVYDSDYELFDKVLEDYPSDIYLFAHTHVPFFTVYKEKIFINSGAVNIPYQRDYSTYGILTINSDNVEYLQKEYRYDKEMVKKYYLESDYYKNNPEWTNILIHCNLSGVDYCNDFSEYINKFKNENGNIEMDVWQKEFINYMNMNNLEIFKQND